MAWVDNFIVLLSDCGKSFRVGSLIVVWLVPGMWAVVFNMCWFIRLLFVSG